MKLSKEEQEYILKNRENQNIYRKAEKKFLMLPALLIYGELYRGLDSGAKIAWTILNDRANLSKKMVGMIKKEMFILFIQIKN